MKFCDNHWAELRKAIEDRGLGQYINTAEGLATQFELDMQGRGKENIVDPLMLSFGMIAEAALERGGLYLLFGDLCPICEGLEKGDTENVKTWISGCTDAVQQHFQEQKLI